MNLATVAAVIAMLGWAASGIIVKSITDIGPLAIVFWRMWMYTVLVIGFLYLRGTPLTRKGIRFSFAGGAALGVDLLLFYAAVHYTTIANATVITACLPILMMLLAGPVFGEAVKLRDWLVAGIAVLGVAAVAYGSSGMPQWSLTGDLLSLGALVAWALYFIFSKLSQEHIASTEYTAGSALIATLVATPVAVFSGQVFVMPSVDAWVWLIVLALGPGVTSHMLMNWSIRGLSAALSSTLTLAIPIAATLMAWVFLGEKIVISQAIGICVVVASLSYLVLTTNLTSSTPAKNLESSQSP
ncbi:MAG: DMT family transporter [Pseudomonadales bacterium]|nr:DMT family transporter [Pseudomonadales bacterium]